MDFDTERIQGLIDSIQDYIKEKEVERRVIELNLDECNKSEEEDDLVSAGLKVRVTNNLHSNARVAGRMRNVSCSARDMS